MPIIPMMIKLRYLYGAVDMALYGKDLLRVKWTIGAQGAIYGLLKLDHHKCFSKLFHTPPSGWDLVHKLKMDYDTGEIWPQHLPKPLFCTVLPKPFYFRNIPYRYLLGYRYMRLKEFDKNKLLTPANTVKILRGMMSVFLKIHLHGYVFHDICWLNIKKTNNSRAIIVDIDGCVKQTAPYAQLSGSKAYHQLFLCLDTDLEHLPVLSLVQMWLSMSMGLNLGDPKIFWGGSRGGALQINSLLKKIIWEKKDLPESFRIASLPYRENLGKWVNDAIEIAREIIHNDSWTLFNHLLGEIDYRPAIANYPQKILWALRYLLFFYRKNRF